MRNSKSLAAACLALAAVAATAADLNPACRAPGQPVDEAGFVTIGGIPQWVLVQGRDCANPVVLILHGGPGNPNTPFAQTLFGGWAGEFTVVQWDQRGAGKTFGASRPTEDEPLTIEQMTRDGLAVAQHLTQRLGKRKLILMGGSWGSALAVHMLQARPALFHAYVGTAQLVGWEMNLQASFARTHGLANAAGDADALAKLDAIGPPPWTDPRAFGILRRVTRKYEAAATDPAPQNWFRFGPGYDTPAYEAMYEAGEEYSYLQFVGMRGKGMGARIDLPTLGRRFEMPIFLLHGDQDLATTPEVARAYFDSVAAPRKEFIRMPRTGHDPNPTMLAMQRDVLLTKVRAESLAADAR